MHPETRSCRCWFLHCSPHSSGMWWGNFCSRQPQFQKNDFERAWSFTFSFVIVWGFCGKEKLQHFEVYGVPICNFKDKCVIVLYLLYFFLMKPSILVSQRCCVFSRKASTCSQTVLGGLLDLSCSAGDAWNLQLLLVPITSTPAWGMRWMYMPNLPGLTRLSSSPGFWPCPKCNFFLRSCATWEDVGAGGKESVCGVCVASLV